MLSIPSFIVFLSIFWFLVYWVLGGVFFALVTILRLGRVRKLRFSCLFTLLSALCGYGAAYFGMYGAETSIQSCSFDASGRAEMILGVFGCGFGAIMSAFLIGAFVLTLGGFLLMTISKTKTKPWIILNQEETDAVEEDKESQVQKGEEPIEAIQPSKFF